MISAIQFILVIIVNLVIEVFAAVMIFSEYDKKKIVWLTVAVNLITNPIVNVLFQLYMDYFSFPNLFDYIGLLLAFLLLETFVLIVESEIFRKYLNLTRSVAYSKLFAINLISWITGTVAIFILKFLFLTY